jgi:Lon protease-like protein
VEEIGLFVLPIVLLPGERIPLHVFEERYKELIGECVEASTTFGLIYGDGDGIREVGTHAAVVDVLSSYPDGRMDILVEGGDRLRVTQITEGRSFATARFEPFVDDLDPPDEGELKEVLEALAGVVAATGGEFDKEGANLQSFALAARIPLPASIRLELVEMTSERLRLQRLQVLFAETAAALIRKQQVARIAAGNGHAKL